LLQVYSLKLLSLLSLESAEALNCLGESTLLRLKRHGRGRPRQRKNKIWDYKCVRD
jgi:hypothetical protein